MVVPPASAELVNKQRRTMVQTHVNHSQHLFERTHEKFIATWPAHQPIKSDHQKL